MKLRKLWIPALLLTLVGGAAKICDTLFNVNGDGFFFSSTVCNIIFAAAILLLFVIGYIMSLADRKKVFQAEVRKDALCGVFGFIASVAIIGTSVVILLTQNFASSRFAESIFGIIAGGILLYESCISFTGHNGMKRIPVAGLLVPLWCVLRFIALFSTYTQTSLHATEKFDIIAVAFLVMFLFYQAMFFAGVNNSNAVRKSTVYGTVFVSIAVVVCVDLFIKMIFPAPVVHNIDSQVAEPSLVNIMTYVGDLALCAYAVFFIKDALRSAQETLKDEDEDEEDTLLAGIAVTDIPGAKPAEEKKTSRTDEQASEDENKQAKPSGDNKPSAADKELPASPGAEEKKKELPKKPAEANISDPVKPVPPGEPEETVKIYQKPEAKPAPKPAAAQKPEAKPAPKPEAPQKPEAKPAPKPEAPQKPEAKPAPKPAAPQKPEAKPAPKPATPQKPEAKPAPKPAAPQKPEAKPAPKPATPQKPEAKPAASSDDGYAELLQMLDDLSN